MKKFLILVAAIAMTAGLSAQTPAQSAPPPKDPPQSKPDQKTEPKAAPSIVGKWNMSVETAQGSNPSSVEMKLDGKKVTGTVASQYGTNPIEGQFADGKLTFNLTIDTGSQQLLIAFAGAFKDDGSLAGSATIAEMAPMTWTATRVKDKQ